eukprot:1731836-Prymnesium_polylepis.1
MGGSDGRQRREAATGGSDGRQRWEAHGREAAMLTGLRADNFGTRKCGGSSTVGPLTGVRAKEEVVDGDEDHLERPANLGERIGGEGPPGA